jgi:hypothetical protein
LIYDEAQESHLIDKSNNSSHLTHTLSSSTLKKPDSYNGSSSSCSSIAGSLTSSTKNPSEPKPSDPTSTTKASKNINLNDLNESAIKKVLEKCFDQLTKTNRLNTPCIYVKRKSSALTDQFKLIDVNPNSAGAFNKPIILEPNNNSVSSLIINDSGIVNNSLNRSRPSGQSKNPDFGDVSSVSSMSSIDNPKIKQTVVEKAVDMLNAPTNTLLLSATNEVNELYSLKITFV